MAKKSLPDWLNSSMWSTSHPLVDDPVQSSTLFSVAPVTEFRADPQLQVPRPFTAPRNERPHLAKPENLDEDSDTSCNRSKIEIDGDDTDKQPSVRLSAEDISRQAQLLTELSRKVINMKELRRITSQGIPDNGVGIRAKSWKLLLGYLPLDRSFWSSELAKKRSQYRRFREELLMKPSEITRRMETAEGSIKETRCAGSGSLLRRREIIHGEHPLNLQKTSIWYQFFQDAEVMEQIDRDVKRTHPDIPFFCGDTNFSKSNQESMKNILIIFAKLNPGIRYVQGMNEVLAPIFYAFRNDSDEEMLGAEPDSFFCFVELLGRFRDNFCQQLDNSDVGICSMITKLSQLLKEHDEELWRHLEVSTKVNPQFYAFRWITLLLTQEFNFAGSLRIWDTLLSDAEGPRETLLCICCAMLILLRRRLLAGDFTCNLRLLQNYPPTNIDHLLYVASKLRIKASI